MIKFFFLIFTFFLLLSIPSVSQSDSTDVDTPNSADDNKDNDNKDDKDDTGKDEKDNEDEKEKNQSNSKNKFKYRIALDGLLNKGNVNRALISFRNILNYEVKKFGINMNTYAATGSQNKNLAEEEVLNNLTTRYNLTKKFYILGLNTFEHSHLRGINLRWQAGAGLGLDIWKSDTNSLTISNAFLYESTDFTKIPDINTIRNSTRIKGLHSFRHKHLVLLHETFFQPSVINISNITFRTNITVSLPITKFTSIRLTCNDSYETIIQPNKKHNDLQLTFGFSISN
jgi:hypothetical protein